MIRLHKSNYKIKGSDPLLRKKAKRFFDYQKIWDDEALLSQLQEYNKQFPIDRGYANKLCVGEMLHTLEHAGFIKVIDNVVWGISYDPKPERYMLWAHPSGLLCTAETYDYDATQPDHLQRLNSMHVYSHLNVGFSNMGYQGTLALQSASGGGYMGKTGESYTHRHRSISYPSDLIHELNDLQRAGRIVPFSEQSLNEVAMYTHDQMFIPLHDWKGEFSNIDINKSRTEMFEHIQQHAEYYGRCFWNNVFKISNECNQIIPQLGNVLAVSMYHNASGHGYSTERLEAYNELKRGIGNTAVDFEIFENPHNSRATNSARWLGPYVDQNTILHFFNVEEAAHFIGRLAEHTQERFLEPSDAQIVEKWLHALKSHKTQIDWTQIDTTTTTSHGIAFVHLCVAMDGVRYSEDNPSSLAIEAIERTPSHVLEHLCANPLADGNTLPLMIVDQYLRMHMEYASHRRVLKDTFEEIFKTLNAKVPTAMWNCGHDQTNTIEGIWLHKMLLSSARQTSHLTKQSLDQVLQPLKDLGCEFTPQTSLSLPLRRTRRDDHRVEFLAAEKIAKMPLEEAFTKLMQLENLKEEPRQKILNAVLSEILDGGSQHSPSKRKM